MYGALLTALFLALCGGVSATRMKFKIRNGDGENKVLAKRIRVRALRRTFLAFPPASLLFTHKSGFQYEIQIAHKYVNHVEYS